MQASAPLQTNYNIELPATSRLMHQTMSTQPFPSHYPTDSLMAYGQPGASNQVSYINDMDDQLVTYTPINYYESPRQVDYMRNTVTESNYLSVQSTPRERMPV